MIALDELEVLGASTIVYQAGASRGLAGLSNGEKATSLPVKVPLVDSIGAGDAVVAGFLAGYLSWRLAPKEPRHCLVLFSAYGNAAR